MPGGLFTIFMVLVLIAFWGYEIHLMIFYKNNSTDEHLYATDFEALGNVEMEDLGSMPIMTVYYKNERLKTYSETICSEFNGDCS